MSNQYPMDEYVNSYYGEYGKLVVELRKLKSHLQLMDGLVEGLTKAEVIDLEMRLFKALSSLGDANEILAKSLTYDKRK